MIPPQIWIALAIAAAGFAGGWTLNGWRLSGDLAECRGHAEQLQSAYLVLAKKTQQQNAAVADLTRKGAEAREAGRQASIAAAAREMAQAEQLAALQAKAAAPTPEGRTCVDAWADFKAGTK